MYVCIIVSLQNFSCLPFFIRWLAMAKRYWLSSMKDNANSCLKLKQTVIWAFCLHNFGWYLKVKVGFRKAKTLFTEGKGFFAFFSDQAMFDPWSLVDHRRGDSTPHSSRQRKRSRNHRLLLQQCMQTKLFLHRLLQLWSPQFVEAPSRFYLTVRLAHAIKTGLRSIKPVNLFWWICNRSLGYLVVSSAPK